LEQLDQATKRREQEECSGRDEKREKKSRKTVFDTLGT
jgi:hypothetical protein